MYAFLDESGDSGLNGSKTLVLTLVFMKNKQLASDIIHRTRERLKNSKKGKKFLAKTGGEIKYSRFPEKPILVQTFDEINGLDLKIFVAFVNKSKIGRNIEDSEKEGILVQTLMYAVNKYIRNELSKLNVDPENTSEFFQSDEYRLSTWDGVLQFLKQKECDTIVADGNYFSSSKDRYFLLKKQVHKNLEGKLEIGIVVAEVSKLEFAENKKDPEKKELVIRLVHKNSSTETALQITDLISGTIYDKLEHGNEEYFEKIKTKVKEIKEVKR